jgi:heat shock protein HslJ
MSPRSWLLILGLLASPAAASAVTLEGVTWRLTGLSGQGPEVLAALQRPATARFEAGKVSGFSGCNQFGGEYTVEADRVTLGPLAGTMMACPEPASSFESAFRSAFSGALRYAIAAGQLKLTTASGDVLVFEPEPAPTLEGVGWEVTGFHNGRQAVVSLVAGSRITLSLADGTVSGSAGCNTFRAPYSVQGNAVEIGPAATTRKACAEELMAQERAFLAALESAVSWSVAGGVLDMHRADAERALMATVER